MFKRPNKLAKEKKNQVCRLRKENCWYSRGRVGSFQDREWRASNVYINANDCKELPPSKKKKNISLNNLEKKKVEDSGFILFST